MLKKWERREGPVGAVSVGVNGLDDALGREGIALGYWEVTGDEGA
jgi:RecA/RadA recombinase